MDVYQIVTDRIIEQLEQGYIPWQKPWLTFRQGAFNRVTKRPYSILNQMLLNKEGEWATFKQWSSLGGKIKKGAKSSVVVFWKIQKIEDMEDDEPVIKQIPLLRYYNVFHISDVEGVEPLNDEPELYDTSPIEVADKVFMDYITREQIKLDISKQNKACYCPSLDSLTLPLMEQFENAEAFYSTAFHESVHSTMKKDRCDREKENKGAFFGSEDYSKEELVAEIGSSALMNNVGIETENTFKNSAAYIQNWLKVLKNDKKFIISASSKAEKAVKYILGETEDEVQALA